MERIDSYIVFLELIPAMHKMLQAMISPEGFSALLNFGCSWYTPKYHENYRGAVTTLSV